MSRRKTTIEEFEQFRCACEKWRTLLGLTHWTIYYKHCKIKDAYASITSNKDSRVAVIRLAVKVDENWQGFESSALHEVLHLALLDDDEAVVNRLQCVLQLVPKDASVIAGV